ncbi:flagellar hook-associated family protein [Ciceribacter sp. L1K22]|uniref:flagellar hook-associated family protein n=1 Tax=Ciceribacter sp. L1K22 TaxID=2820275 RepID=UPI001ABED61A|nr:flagellar hook-associated family protein [Ciceribacter sp. L1K22]MBO3758350.1 flagellar hook-associated family protein [Ciceribacter sp. L1K22]
MKTSTVSSLSIQNAMRLTIMQAQNELLKSQQEATTGKYYDVGAELGSRTSMSLDLSRESMRLQSLLETNAIAKQRLESAQEAMNQMATSAQSMMNGLVVVSGTTDANNLEVARKTASDAFDNFISMANMSVSGEYLFSGINTDVKPLVDSSVFMADFETAFFGEFGFNSDDPLTATITPTQMEDFITNTVEPMFAAGAVPGWGNWSTASDDVMMSRVSTTETIATSTSVNSEGMRDFALASVLSMGLLTLNLDAEVLNVVTEKAVNYTGQTISGVDAQRTQLGLSQERLEKANASLEIQQDIIETNFTSMVEVDVYEASTRVNNLLSLVEASYTLTSKIQQLSLVNYL